jgi:putative FmdB family regulatory protein
MPVYDFECQGCSKVFTLLVRSDETPTCECGGNLLRRFSPTKYLFYPYKLNDDERYRVLRAHELSKHSKQAQKVAEVAAELNAMPPMVDVE